MKKAGKIENEIITGKEHMMLHRHFTIKAHARRIGLQRIPDDNEIVQGKNFSETAFGRYYGTYSKMCSRVGFNMFEYFEEHDYDENDVLNDIRKIADITGHAPTLIEYNMISPVPFRVLKKYYRNLSSAVAAADLQGPIDQSRKFSDKRLLQILKDIGKKEKRIPLRKDIRKLHVPKMKVFRLRFGSFRKSLIAAGYKLPPDKRNVSANTRKKIRFNKLLKKFSGQY